MLFCLILEVIAINKWKAHYTDESHDLDIYIENNFSSDNIRTSLTMMIDDIEFVGMSFDEWEVYHKENMPIASEKFLLLEVCDGYVLQKFRLEVFIPIQIADVSQNQCKQGVLSFCYKEEGNYCEFFKLTVEDEIFECENPSIDFETSLLQICKKVSGKYLLRCCFGCLYSDYSPYGNNTFASMLCYLSVADQYINVYGKYSRTDGKIPIWDVYEHGKQKQETSLCEGFTPRIECLGGYRGQIYD